MREHGGDLAAAIARFGGEPTDWLDLSTGINPVAYPLPELSPSDWQRLPEKEDIAALETAAARHFGLADGAPCVAVCGAQAGIQLMPILTGPGRVLVREPTYNEHAARFWAAAHEVVEVQSLPTMTVEPDDIVVVVNPNNPDGVSHFPDDLLALAERVRMLIVDESFADSKPSLSLAPFLGRDGVVVLRSFGKYFGLAGLRLGFVLGSEHDMAQVRSLAGPWAVSGPAVRIGARAYRDTEWISKTRSRLADDLGRIKALASGFGIEVVGGTDLFTTLRFPDAEVAQCTLAQHRIWTRRFSYSEHWLRLGHPGTEDGWERLAIALRAAG
jgi:cobalamin biosynthesis protein CobC